MNRGESSAIHRTQESTGLWSMRSGRSENRSCSTPGAIISDTGKRRKEYRIPYFSDVPETERRIADYDARFAAATAYDEADYKAYDDLKAHYDHLMHEWEKASYELEITENG